MAYRGISQNDPYKLGTPQFSGCPLISQGYQLTLVFVCEGFCYGVIVVATIPIILVMDTPSPKPQTLNSKTYRYYSWFYDLGLGLLAAGGCLGLVKRIRQACYPLTNGESKGKEHGA